MSQITFYTNPMSRGRIARWMLEEVGAPYETVILPYGPEMKSETFRAVNPMGKVPALVHGDAIVTEGAAICCYLADAFPEAGLAPDPTSPERGAYYRWMFFAAGPLEQAVINQSFGFELSDDPMAARRAGWGSFETVKATLDGLLADGRAYLLGDTFSAVDVYLGSQIAWGLQFGTIPETADMTAYAARIMARDAAIRATELDEAAAGNMSAPG